MRSLFIATALFALMVWDLTMNHGRGFRNASYILSNVLRQAGVG